MSDIQKMIFVVQEHFASHHHFDFRLEMDGVLKSWAVPMGVPVEFGKKHLAVEVNDHELEYANFEGDIPEGNYGAGTVKIWDKGNYTLIERNQKKIEFIPEGKKLFGRYVLILFKEEKGKRYWLIFKKHEHQK